MTGCAQPFTQSDGTSEGRQNCLEYSKQGSARREAGLLLVCGARPGVAAALVWPLRLRLLFRRCCERQPRFRPHDVPHRANNEDSRPRSPLLSWSLLLFPSGYSSPFSFGPLHTPLCPPHCSFSLDLPGNESLDLSTSLLFLEPLRSTRPFDLSGHHGRCTIYATDESRHDPPRRSSLLRFPLLPAVAVLLALLVVPKAPGCR